MTDECGNILSSEAFNYDAAGNITNAPDSCFVYDTNNRLTMFDGHTVKYDADGNMTSAPLGSSVKSFEYDSANRLTKVGSYTYTYNAEDVRVKSTDIVHSINATYVYNTNCALSQVLLSNRNGTVVKYIYGVGLIGEERHGYFQTYHYDYRGSTVAITNECGELTFTFAYDTYGKLLTEYDYSDAIFLYNGRDGVITDRNGLVYMRARYYSPEMKRFINADIIPGEISNAITLNRYAYANGNPVSNIDPFGLSADSSRTGEIYDAMKDIFGGVTNINQFGEAYIEFYQYLYDSGLLAVKTDKKIEIDFGDFVVYYKVEGQVGSGENVFDISQTLEILKSKSVTDFLDASGIFEREVGAVVIPIRTADNFNSQLQAGISVDFLNKTVTGDFSYQTTYSYGINSFSRTVGVEYEASWPTRSVSYDHGLGNVPVPEIIPQKNTSKEPSASRKGGYLIAEYLSNISVSPNSANQLAFSGVLLGGAMLVGLYSRLHAVR